MRVLKFMFVFSWGLLITLLAGFVTENRQLEAQLIEVERRLTESESYIQNPYESQQKLKDAGYYDGKIDGIWGERTEKAYGNWCASKYFKEK